MILFQECLSSRYCIKRLHRSPHGHSKALRTCAIEFHSIIGPPNWLTKGATNRFNEGSQPVYCGKTQSIAPNRYFSGTEVFFVFWFWQVLIDFSSFSQDLGLSLGSQLGCVLAVFLKLQSPFTPCRNEIWKCFGTCQAEFIHPFRGP